MKLLHTKTTHAFSYLRSMRSALGRLQVVCVFVCSLHLINYITVSAFTTHTSRGPQSVNSEMYVVLCVALQTREHRCQHSSLLYSIETALNVLYA